MITTAPVTPVSWLLAPDRSATAVRDPLAAMGYTFQLRGKIGDVQAIELSGRRPIGTSDPRGIGRVTVE